MTKLLLFSLSLFVGYAIFYHSYANGLRELALHTIEAGKLPGAAKLPLRTHYTGLEQTDKLLTTLTVFFWPVSDGSHPGLFLHSIAFSGAFCAAWVLVSIESWRKGNQWTIAAFPAVFGLAAQVFTFAFATPLYLGLSLAVGALPTAENIRVPRAVLKSIPAVFTVGMAVPSLLMTLPLSDQITPDLKQIFIAVWQPWPAYVAILLWVAYYVVGVVVSDNNASLEGKRSNLSALRHAYAFALIQATLSHLVAVIISTATVVAPFLFQTRFVTDLHPTAVLRTALPWASPLEQVTNVADGVHTFLRWDYNIGTVGVLVWAIHSYLVSGQRIGLGDIGKVLGLTALTGPVGAAVVLIWERDETVLAREREAVDKKKL